MKSILYAVALSSLMFNTSALAGVDTTNPNQPSGITLTFIAPAAGTIATGTVQTLNGLLVATTTGPVNISPPQALRILREINTLLPGKITPRIQEIRVAIEKLLAERDV